MNTKQEGCVYVSLYLSPYIYLKPNYFFEVQSYLPLMNFHNSYHSDTTLHAEVEGKGTFLKRITKQVGSRNCLSSPFTLTAHSNSLLRPSHATEIHVKPHHRKAANKVASHRAAKRPLTFPRSIKHPLLYNQTTAADVLPCHSNS